MGEVRNTRRKEGRRSDEPCAHMAAPIRFERVKMRPRKGRRSRRAETNPKAGVPRESKWGMIEGGAEGENVLRYSVWRSTMKREISRGLRRKGRLEPRRGE